MQKLKAALRDDNKEQLQLNQQAAQNQVVLQQIRITPVKLEIPLDQIVEILLKNKN